MLKSRLTWQPTGGWNFDLKVDGVPLRGKLGFLHREHDTGVRTLPTTVEQAQLYASCTISPGVFYQGAGPRAVAGPSVSAFNLKTGDLAYCNVDKQYYFFLAAAKVCQRPRYISHTSF